MKKAICFLLISVMMFSFFACAEEFTLHSGVKFGMTKEEAIALEQSAGFEYKESVTEAEKTKAKSLIEVSGTIAGMPNSDVEYSIDQEGKVFAATYLLGTPRYNTESDFNINT